MALPSFSRCSLWTKSTQSYGKYSVCVCVCVLIACISVRFPFIQTVFTSTQVFNCCDYRNFPTDLSALVLGDLYYTRLSLSGVSEHLSHNALLELHQMLHANLSSNISKVCLQ